MTVWHVWTDGSCQHGMAQAPKGLGGWGGWAAIVEHGSDGVVLRGRVPDTTNVRMELRAAIEGLRAVPVGAPTILHTDCTTLLSVHFAWRNGDLTSFRGVDARYWLELDGEFDRRDVGVHLIVKGEVDAVHRKVHTMAGAEARGGLRNLPVNVIPFEETKRDHKKRRRGSPLLVHETGCSTSSCVSTCQVWLEHGKDVYTSRRQSERRRTG